MNIDYVERHFTDLHTGDADCFEAMASVVLTYQREHNSVYRRWSHAATYMPVAAFKYAPVTCFPPEEADIVFKSSGTGSGRSSLHYVRRLSVYERAVRVHFEAVFGRGPFTLVAHLPNYLDTGRNSSLVYMVDCLIRAYGDAKSGFFLNDTALLEEAIQHCHGERSPLLLFGAAFGLLHLVEKRTWKLPVGARVIETGGMKTFRKEICRNELHRRLADGFAVPKSQVWSEYGMCELMSQAWAQGSSVYFPPPWMHFRVVNHLDSTDEMPEGRPGTLAVLDLANMHSVSAILTEDVAVKRGAGFEILGRVSQSDLRGCNFLVDGT